MSKYHVLSPVEHDGKSYEVDSEIEVKDEKQAKALIASGVIAEHAPKKDSRKGD